MKITCKQLIHFRGIQVFKSDPRYFGPLDTLFTRYNILLRRPVFPDNTLLFLAEPVTFCLASMFDVLIKCVPIKKRVYFSVSCDYDEISIYFIIHQKTHRQIKTDVSCD